MNKLVRYFTCTISVALLVIPMAGNTAGFNVSKSQFKFYADHPGFSVFDRQVWNPVSPHNETGIYMYYHGHIDPSVTCGVIDNCDGESCFKKSPPWGAASLMGLDNPTTWSPKCPFTPHYGISMASISKKSPDGHKGIGIYTHTGSNFAKLGRAFLQPKHLFGPDNPSFNVHGMYVGFQAIANGTMKPFSAACTWAATPSTCSDSVRMRVWTKQVVASFQAPQGVQTLQKMAFVLTNLSDATGKSRIEFTPYTFCAGVNCSYSVGRSSFDPNQGNAAFVGGPLLSGGAATKLPGGTPLWESYGPKTKSEGFDTTWFHYEISWKNFKGILRYLTTKGGKNGNIDSDVAADFGPNWNQPANWALKNYRFAQEVYNPRWDEGLIGSIGGHTNWIQIDAIKK